MTDALEETPSGTGPHSITCRSCGRRLPALRSPRCNWCGAAIPAEDYAAIAEQSRRVMVLPDPTPLPPVFPYGYGPPSYLGGWGRRPQGGFLPRAVQTFRPATPGQQRLRAVVVALFGLLGAVKVGAHLYVLWELHRAMQALPH